MSASGTVIVLAMHGVPPTDFPRTELSEFFTLHARFAHAPPGADPARKRYEELASRVCDWPRTDTNDPYHEASLELAHELALVTGHRILVGFNEFCGPTVDEALDRAAATGADRVMVVTPMMTRGGEHSEKDIPAAIARARTRHPGVTFIYVWPILGEDVARFLAEMVARFTPPA
jgi:sirohydrochlorin cobaltochelatase